MLFKKSPLLWAQHIGSLMVICAKLKWLGQLLQNLRDLRVVLIVSATLTTAQYVVS